MNRTFAQMCSIGAISAPLFGGCTVRHIRREDVHSRSDEREAAHEADEAERTEERFGEKAERKEDRRNQGRDGRGRG